MAGYKVSPALYNQIVTTLTFVLQFLMRYYTPGDDIFFFGFSRGAYTARFLAEMLDSVGLLSVSLLQRRQCQTRH